LRRARFVASWVGLDSCTKIQMHEESDHRSGAFEMTDGERAEIRACMDPGLREMRRQLFQFAVSSGLLVAFLCVLSSAARSSRGRRRDHATGGMLLFGAIMLNAVVTAVHGRSFKRRFRRDLEQRFPADGTRRQALLDLLDPMRTAGRS